MSLTFSLEMFSELILKTCSRYIEDNPLSDENVEISDDIVDGKKYHISTLKYNGDPNHSNKKLRYE